VVFAGDGLRATGAMPPIGEPSPDRLAVRSRPRSAADFAYIVDPLRRLCEASVATGNPVMWT
jgi:hypothetical protein